jgi:hypothetical protein
MEDPAAFLYSSEFGLGACTVVYCEIQTETAR